MIYNEDIEDEYKFNFNHFYPSFQSYTNSNPNEKKENSQNNSNQMAIQKKKRSTISNYIDDDKENNLPNIPNRLNNQIQINSENTTKLFNIRKSNKKNQDNKEEQNNSKVLPSLLSSSN